jgi:hypothetical protein
MPPDFFGNIVHNLTSLSSLHFPDHALQRNADNVAVMKPGAELIGQVEPESVNPIDVFGPEPWWMWPEVYENRWAIRRDDFQGERVPRLG